MKYVLLLLLVSCGTKGIPITCEQKFQECMSKETLKEVTEIMGASFLPEHKKICYNELRKCTK